MAQAQSLPVLASDEYGSAQIAELVTVGPLLSQKIQKKQSAAGAGIPRTTLALS
jgi:hypothetical protein